MDEDFIRDIAYILGLTEDEVEDILNEEDMWDEFYDED